MSRFYFNLFKDYLRAAIDRAKDGSHSYTSDEINYYQLFYSYFSTYSSQQGLKNNPSGDRNLWNALSIPDPSPKALLNLELTLNDDSSNDENLLPALTSEFTNISKSCLNDIMGIGKPNISMCTFNGK